MCILANISQDKPATTKMLEEIDYEIETYSIPRCKNSMREEHVNIIPKRRKDR
jgi:hypothetical protein